ncbi:MAG: LamG-like jellyroll fold domain-containing protein, partial [Candidatus Kariarchaeaceae archaeon]
KNITIPSSLIKESLIEFPLLVDIYDQDLKHALNRGFDILFTDENNSKLDHEIELFEKSYNSTHTHLTAWVKTNLSNSVDTTLMMYFGFPFAENQENSTGVWSNGYEAVWHLNEKPSEVIVDSTGQYNGTALGSMTTADLSKGQITNGLYFDGVDNRITVGNIDSDDWTQLTLEAWISHERLTDTGVIVTKENDNGGGYTWTLRIDDQKVQSRLETDGPGGDYFWVQTSDAITNVDTWYHVVFTWDGLTEYYYVDDIYYGKFDTTGLSILNSNDEVSIGATASGNTEHFEGIIDELRVSSLTRSEYWIFTQTINQRDPELFYTLGSMEKYELEEDWPFISLDYRKNITILSNQIDQNVTEFPFLLDLIDENLHDNAQQDGEDILFTDINGFRLEHEIEGYAYNYNSSHSRLRAWINIPSLSNVFDVNITMYYGNSTVIRYDKSNDVWHEYYSVWHLSEVVADGAITLGIHQDSTGNGFNGDQMRNDEVKGVINRGQNFDGDLDNILIPASLELNPTSELMISGWFKLNNEFNNTTSTSQLILENYLDGQHNLHLGLVGLDYNKNDVLNGSLVFKVENGGIFTYKWTNRTVWQTDTWFHFALIHNSSNPSSNKIYVNGIDDTSNSDDSCSPCSISLDFSGEWGFGGGNADGQFPGNIGWFNGSLDEIRISRKISDLEKVIDEINNQLVPKSFYTISEEFFTDYDAPIINNFGVEQTGTGQTTYWANITDYKGIVSSAKIEINGSIYDMSYNGTYWISQKNPNFNEYYLYRIINTTDSRGNFIIQPSVYQNITFNYDITTPEILDWIYDANIGNLGTFKANVTDQWGIIDTVLVEIISCSGCGAPPIYSVMVKSGIEYSNDTILMARGEIFFKIIANDTSGNIAETILTQGFATNKAPSVNNIAFNSTNPFSNQSLSINYNFVDLEGDPEEGTQIRWYRNGTLQSSYNDLLSIPSNALSKEDIWNVTVRPKDGILFGMINKTYSLANVLNSAPEALNLILTSNPTTSENLIANWTYFDIDNDPESENWLINWYRNDIYLPSFDNEVTIPSASTFKDEKWYYSLRVFDGTNYSQLYISSNETIQNSIPIVITPSILGAPVLNTTDNLEINYGFFDSDLGDTENVSKRIIYWFVNGLYNSSFDNLNIIGSGNTTGSDVWYYVIKVFDGTDYSMNRTSIGISIDSTSNEAPSVSNLQILGNSSRDCYAVGCTANYNLYASYIYDDSDGHIESGSVIRWYKNGILQSQFNDTIVIDLSYIYRGDVWNYTITPVDVLGLNGSQISSPSITILNSSPEIFFAEITNTEVYTTSTLTIEYQYIDENNDLMADFHIKWYRNGSEMPSVENLTDIPSFMILKNDIWNFNISIFDGSNWSIWKVSNFKEVLNTLPTIDNIRLTGGGTTLEDITLTYDFFDLDNDTDQSSYLWVIGADFNGTAGKTLQHTEESLKAGKTVYVIITLSDGDPIPEPILSFKYDFGYIIVGNSIPEIVNTPLIFSENGNDKYFVNASIFVNYNATDIDGSNDYNFAYDIDYSNGLVFGAEYRWYKQISQN